MPKHRLSDVRAVIATPDGLELGDFSCVYRLMEHPDEAVFGTLEECEDFARDVLNGITADDCKLGPPAVLLDHRPGAPSGRKDLYDEYGVRLSQPMMEKHGLVDESTWYVKLTLRREEHATVLCLSLHRLEHDMVRLGGKLKPAW